MTHKLLVLSLILLSSILNATVINGGSSQITGKVINSKGEILIGVNVFLKNTNLGSATNEEGIFKIKNVPTGEFKIIASMIGFKSDKKTLNVLPNKTIEVNFKLKMSLLEMGSIVVTGTVSPYLYEESPVKTEVVPKKLIDQTKSVNLAEALSLQTGVRVENDCQNCNFTQVRILGFDGKYSQILIDGDPVVSSLAGVYALEQFPQEMIGQIEVIKGGGSALYGAGAVAGTINLRTETPVLNSYRFDYLGTSIKGRMDQKVGVVAQLVSEDSKSGIYLFGSLRNRNQYDHNGDGYSELGKLENQSIGFNWIYKPINNGELKTEMHMIHEKRRGGNKFHLQNHEADVSEALEHMRYGGKIRWQKNLSAVWDYSAYAAISYLTRDSYYGGLSDEDGDNLISSAEQIAALAFYGNTKNSTFITGAKTGYRFDINKFTFGTEYYVDVLNDKSVKEEKYHIDHQYKNFGAFIQDEISFMDDHLNIIAGVRLDKHSELNDVVFSPRFSLKYEMFEGLNLRTSYSTGFKAPQTFDEDLHIESLGGNQRVVRNVEGLKPEYSRSISGSIEIEKYFGEIPLLVGITGFYTNLTDAFVTVESENQPDDLILWDRINSDGAKISGFEIDFGIKPLEFFELRSGFTFKTNEYDSKQEIFDGVYSQRFLRTPDIFGYIWSSFDLSKHWKLFASFKYTGPMSVPNENTETIKFNTAQFWEIDLGAEYKLTFLSTLGAELSFGVKNIFDAFQKDLGVGSDRDPAYLYGPQLPRRLYVGVKSKL